MKKLSRKQWERDVKNGILNRRGRRKGQRKNRSRKSRVGSNRDPVNQWIDDKIAKGELSITIDKRRYVTIFLPEKMNFYADYEQTVLYMFAIRKFLVARAISPMAYRLSSVNFDNLRMISTSAALVLTAELSKWNDEIRQRLTPDVNNWDPDILKKFRDLGFFTLFIKSPANLCRSQDPETSSVSLVKYIKGKCGDNDKARILKHEIVDIVGDEICKWTFLHSGLTEAITNVTHHAYPDSYAFSESSKTWYLSGSYNRNTKVLKVVFYDQGIGIPKSLPASQVWERVLSFLSRVPIAERKRDEVLLRAAVQISRTRTGSPDRGRGLQDLLEFIRQRKEGYLSILSLRGLYKFAVNNGIETTKSEHFNNPIQGTLIIWSATLND